MKKRLGFAIVGCGKIAPRHAAEAARKGALVAVCDIVKVRADELAAQYNAAAFYRFEDMLRTPGIDVVSICTPNGLHASQSILALQAGHHVLCEKPLCISSTDGREMIDVSRQTGKKLWVVKSTRYNPALVKLKELVDQKAFGQLYSFQLNCFWNRPAAYYTDSWKGTLALDGGTLYTQFSHYIDALIWIFGGVRQLSGVRKNMAHPAVEFEDCGTVSMEMESGMLGGLAWSVNTFKRNMEVSLTLIAEKGTIRIGGEYLNKLEYQIIEGARIEYPETGSANDYGTYQGSMSNHDKIYENLVKVLEDDTHPFSHAIDGLKTVETIERIYNTVSLS